MKRRLFNLPAAMRYALSLTLLCVFLSCFPGCTAHPRAGSQQHPSEAGRATVQPPATAEVGLRITPGLGIGPVHLGMTPQQVEAAMGSPTRKPGPKHWEYADAIGVAFDRHDKVSLISGGWWCFSDLPAAVDHPFRGSFANGVIVGANMEQVRAAFGDPESEDVLDADLQFIHWRYGDLGLDVSFRAGELVHVIVFPKRQR